MSIKTLRNVKPKRISIDLDKDRTLCFDMNAFADLEEKYGSIDEALKLLQEGKISTLRTILWTGLLADDETLTERQVGTFVGLTNIEFVMSKINECISDSLPVVEESKNDVPK